MNPDLPDELYEEILRLCPSHVLFRVSMTNEHWFQHALKCLKSLSTPALWYTQLWSLPIHPIGFKQIVIRAPPVVDVVWQHEMKLLTPQKLVPSLVRMITQQLDTLEHLEINEPLSLDGLMTILDAVTQCPLINSLEMTLPKGNWKPDPQALVAFGQKLALLPNLRFLTIHNSFGELDVFPEDLLSLICSNCKCLTELILPDCAPRSLSSVSKVKGLKILGLAADAVEQLVDLVPSSVEELKKLLDHLSPALSHKIEVIFVENQRTPGAVQFSENLFSLLVPLPTCSLEMLQMLFAAGCNVNAQHSTTVPPLYRALESSTAGPRKPSPALFPVVQHATVRADPDDEEGATDAETQRQLDIFKFLLENGADPTQRDPDKGLSIFQAAVSCCKCALQQVYISNFMSLSSIGLFYFRIASSAENFAELLFTQYLEPTRKRYPHLYDGFLYSIPLYAIGSQVQSRAPYATKRGEIAIEPPPIATRPRFFLHKLIHGENSAIKDWILENLSRLRIDPSYQDCFWGYATPVHAAVWNSNASILEILLKQGSKSDIQDESGLYPISVAVKLNCGFEQLVQAALKSGTRSPADLLRNQLSKLAGNKYERMQCLHHCAGFAVSATAELREEVLAALNVAFEELTSNCPELAMDTLCHFGEPEPAIQFKALVSIGMKVSATSTAGTTILRQLILPPTWQVIRIERAADRFEEVIRLLENFHFEELAVIEAAALACFVYGIIKSKTEADVAVPLFSNSGMFKSTENTVYAPKYGSLPQPLTLAQCGNFHKALGFDSASQLTASFQEQRQNFGFVPFKSTFQRKPHPPAPDLPPVDARKRILAAMEKIVQKSGILELFASSDKRALSCLVNAVCSSHAARGLACLPNLPTCLRFLTKIESEGIETELVAFVQSLVAHGADVNAMFLPEGSAVHCLARNAYMNPSALEAIVLRYRGKVDRTFMATLLSDPKTQDRNIDAFCSVLPRLGVNQIAVVCDTIADLASENVAVAFIKRISETGIKFLLCPNAAFDNEPYVSHRDILLEAASRIRSSLTEVLCQLTSDKDQAKQDSALRAKLEQAVLRIARGLDPVLFEPGTITIRSILSLMDVISEDTKQAVLFDIVQASGAASMVYKWDALQNLLQLIKSMNSM